MTRGTAWTERLTWPRATERLLLRPATEADLEAMWRYRRLDSVAAWMGGGAPELGPFVTEALTIGRLGWTLVIERDGVVIGDLMLQIENGWGQAEVREQTVGVQAELGWCLDPAAEGHGYATEGVRELIRIGFADLGLRRLTALCFAVNEPSWRLMERVGMRREAYSVRDSLHRSGEWMDGMLYAILAEEWAEHEAGRHQRQG